MGFGSYQTAWSWLHKIRRAMVRPERAPLAARVEADETYVGGPRPGRSGRGAAGKTRSRAPSRAVEAKPAGAAWAGCVWPWWPTSRLASKASSPPTSPGPRPWPPTAGPAMPASPPRATATSRSISAPAGRRGAPPAGDPPGVRPGQALAAQHHHGAVSKKHLPAYLDEFTFRFNHRRQTSQPPLRPRHPASRPDPPHPLPQSRRHRRYLMVVES